MLPANKQQRSRVRFAKILPNDSSPAPYILHNTKSDLHKMLIYITRFSRSQLYLELTLIPMHTERWCICVLCMSAYFSKSSLSLTSVHPDTWTLHVAAHKIRTEWPVDGWDEGGWHAPSTRCPRSAPATLWRFKVPWLLQYVSSIYTGQPVIFEYHSQHTSASFISSWTAALDNKYLQGGRCLATRTKTPLFLGRRTRHLG